MLYYNSVRNRTTSRPKSDDLTSKSDDLKNRRRLKFF
jgi:hypothetical protein